MEEERRRRKTVEGRGYCKQGGLAACVRVYVCVCGVGGDGGAETGARERETRRGGACCVDGGVMCYVGAWRACTAKLQGEADSPGAGQGWIQRLCQARGCRRAACHVVPPLLTPSSVSHSFWGINNKKANVEECAEHCRSHQPNIVDGEDRGTGRFTVLLGVLTTTPVPRLPPQAPSRNCPATPSPSAPTRCASSQTRTTTPRATAGSNSRRDPPTPRCGRRA